MSLNDLEELKFKGTVDQNLDVKLTRIGENFMMPKASPEAKPNLNED